MMARSDIMSYNRQQHLLSRLGVVKVVVIGKPQVGKTSFIHSFCQNHHPEDIYHIQDVAVYQCNFTHNDKHWIMLLCEIPGDPTFGLEFRTHHCRDSHAIVWMYAIDDPLSLEILRDEWLPVAQRAINLDPIVSVLVGNKRDLRDDPQVIQRLAEDNRTPVTSEQAQGLQHSATIRHFSEISAHSLEDVNEVFRTILTSALNFD